MQGVPSKHMWINGQPPSLRALQQAYLDEEVTEVATAESGAMGCSMGKELKLPLMELSDMMVNG